MLPIILVTSHTCVKLNRLGINTVWDLAAQPGQRIQSQFSIVVSRISLELNDIPCMDLEEVAPDKQQIISSRSLSRRLTEYRELSAAIAEFCSRAVEKLRLQRSVAGCITFIRTNSFNPQEPQYQRPASIKLDIATQDTRVIVARANRLLKEIFKMGYRYHKCGVQLSDSKPESQLGQTELFDFADNGWGVENRQLMTVVDQINRRFPEAIAVAATVLDKSWKPKADHASQRYTTDWRELVRVK